VLITIDNVVSKLEPTPAEQAAVQKVKDKLVCFAPGYRYTYTYKKKWWDGKVTLLDGDDVPTGMLPFVIEELARYNVKMDLDDQRIIQPLTLHPTTMKLWDFQTLALREALRNSLYSTWWPRGVLKVATGGGKTEMACAMIQMAGVRTLFLVHTKDLLHQTKERFQKYGVDAGMLGDGTYETENRVTVATIQTLWSFLNAMEDVNKRQAAVTVLKNVHQVFFDEAHLLAADRDKGNIFIKVSQMMDRAYMRWGLTATPFMKDEYSNWLLRSVTGDVLCDISNRQLIDSGYLAEAKVTMIKCPPCDSVPNKWPDCYEMGIVLHNGRNDRIIKEAARAKSPVLILVTRVPHGDILERRAKAAGLNIPFISGRDCTAFRKKVKSLLQSGKVKGVIASTIWNQGVDIPEIKTLILAGGGKSQIMTLQKLGRGLRLSAGKSHVDLIDFDDRSTRWLRSHSKARRKIWEQEGFAILEKEL
jgi:superfamily II DNA or RNA helicase